MSWCDGVEMAPQDLLRLAADETREVVVLDRPAHRHGGFRLGRLDLLSTDGAERPGNRTDQIAKIGRGDGVPGDIGDDDLRRELCDRPRLLALLFFGLFRHGFASA